MLLHFGCKRQQRSLLTGQEGQPQAFPGGKRITDAADAVAELPPFYLQLLHIHLHRIMESRRSEKTLKSSHEPELPSPITNCVLQCYIHTSLKHLQGWGHHHFPGQPVPMPDQPLHEKILPNVQFKLPLKQKARQILEKVCLHFSYLC